MGLGLWVWIKGLRFKLEFVCKRGDAGLSSKF